MGKKVLEPAKLDDRRRQGRVQEGQERRGGAWVVMSQCDRFRRAKGRGGLSL